MHSLVSIAPFLLLVASSGCGGSKPDATPEITVAAASNLIGAFDEIGRSFTKQTGIKVILSYASTAQLASQIENGAPFDVFAAADVQHVDDLVRNGRLVADSRAIYARGILALWIPKGDAIAVGGLDDLVKATVRSVAIATPTAAPYGKAAVEALRNSGLWARVEPKVVYSTNISMAKQFAASGNADAAFSAYSLLLHERGKILRIDQKLYTPLDQAIGIVSGSTKGESARSFLAFVLGDSGRKELNNLGYLVPPK